MLPVYEEFATFDDSWNPKFSSRPQSNPLDFQFPLRVGAAWSYSSPPNAFYERGNHTVVAYEEVVVPAGRFQCFRIEGVNVFNYSKNYSDTWYLTKWYCPAVKYIAKMNVERLIWQAYAPPTRSVLTSELIDFQLADRKRIQQIPLPADLAVTKPADSLPPDIRAFSGKWAGTWSNGVNHILVVEQIRSPSQATVVFARERAPALSLDKPIYVRAVATITDGQLTFKLRRGEATVTYQLLPSGELSGRYEWGTTVSVSQLQRLD